MQPDLGVAAREDLYGVAHPHAAAVQPPAAARAEDARELVSAGG